MKRINIIVVGRDYLKQIPYFGFINQKSFVINYNKLLQLQLRGSLLKNNNSIGCYKNLPRHVVLNTTVADRFIKVSSYM